MESEEWPREAHDVVRALTIAMIEIGQRWKLAETALADEQRSVRALQLTTGDMDRTIQDLRRQLQELRPSDDEAPF